MIRVLLALACLALGTVAGHAQDSVTSQKEVPLGGNDIRSLPDRSQLPPPFGANLFSSQAAQLMGAPGGLPASSSTQPSQSPGIVNGLPPLHPQTGSAGAAAGSGSAGAAGAAGLGATGSETTTSANPPANANLSQNVSQFPQSNTIPPATVMGVGAAAAVDPNYVIQPGDLLQIHLYGATTLDQPTLVDGNGDIFIPTIGPIHVAGTRLGDLDMLIQFHVEAVYTKSVKVYATIGTALPIQVFVTGAVISPGQYALPPTTSIVAFLQAAGGVDSVRGSYRDIRVMRGNQEIAHVDLYDFLINGRLPKMQLHNHDTIVVGQQGPTIIVSGDVRGPFRFELKRPYDGSQLMMLARPYPDASNVSLVGVRAGVPASFYYRSEQFRDVALHDMDFVTFSADVPTNVMSVKLDGRVQGPTTLVVRREATLMDVLSYVPIDPYFSNIGAIYIRRASVAQAQQRAIEDAIARLKQNVVAAPVITAEQAQIRQQEAQIVFNFANQLKDVRPEGRVVVARDGKLADVRLEDGDVIVLPSRSDLVIVSGEVSIPQSLVYTKGATADQYIASCGGFTDRADRHRILVMKQSGEIEVGPDPAIASGDRIAVLPSADNWTIPVIKDITQIIYQIAVGAGVIAEFK